jgi:HPt (histidine-containing phosphotransfer) domain-containing protein
MLNSFSQSNASDKCRQIDIRVIFDIYGEEGNDILQYALGAFCQEASQYVAQLYLAVSRIDQVEVSRLFHSLDTMAAMIGARQLSQLCADLEVLTLQSVEFEQKYEELQQLWPEILTELERYLAT